MKHTELPRLFATYQETSLYGRYIHLERIAPILKKISLITKVDVVGNSENELPIHLITLGSGPKKLLLWSQMHGNESTTTKALFDLINLLLDKSNRAASDILSNCTLYIVPILSPDGAFAYTRLNYNQVDLNRDAQNRTQRESVVLHDLVHSIQPDIAFNLHGQRTIFSAGNTNLPATVSFLSPAGDTERSVSAPRKVAMDIIKEMNSALQDYIPNQVGRYDDGFNINCVGDTLTNIGIPTILFEAGHYPNDYDREKTRELIFYSFLVGLRYISSAHKIGDNYKDYFKIPENGKCFYDIIVRDVVLNCKNIDVAIQYTEKMEENVVKFIPKVVKIQDLRNFYGHKEIKGRGRAMSSENDGNLIVPETKLLKFYLDSELFLIELGKS